ncbi:hypothetical protein Tsubulata_029510 [Turnera subulata]|uniref:F-box associated beta-propeller type 1 domain-containing protein n=1 Tax=Turnera subulata TaxID=218843 RepID=A0A9Q0JFQ4_9ROSI|nr:hypothetical protein Tsubulata_029510 [Turnera subulata]
MSWLDARYAHGFGYDSASDDYKVFVATCPNYRRVGGRVDIFSLKAGSWKEMENPARELQHLTRARSMGLFLNGALHWEYMNEKDGLTKIIAFDLGKEKFYVVPLPLSPPNYGYKYYSLGVVGEYLCVSFSATNQQGLANIYHQRPTNINVWVMKEYCNEASWVHLISYTPDGIIDDAIYVSNSVPIISVKEGGHIWLQYSAGCIDVLEWIDNNPDEGSYEAEGQYSKKIRFYDRHGGLTTAIPYMEALTSPYASTGIHPSRNF